nr:MAG TPA: hypothetical protein [Caudoviricetes sp.]
MLCGNHQSVPVSIAEELRGERNHVYTWKQII